MVLAVPLDQELLVPNCALWSANVKVVICSHKLQTQFSFVSFPAGLGSLSLRQLHDEALRAVFRPRNTSLI